MVRILPSNHDGGPAKTVKQPKRESADTQLRFPSSIEMPEFTETLKGALQSTRSACEQVNLEIRRFRDEYEGRVRDQQDQIKFLQAKSDWLCRNNEALQADVQVQRTNHDLVIGDMVRICDENQRILEERDKERFEKDLNNLIIDQYRDETIEKRRIIEAKDVEIGYLAEKLTNMEAEAYRLRAQCSHHDRGIGEVQSVGTRKRPNRKRQGKARRGRPAWQR
ncbi:hypothetical protein F5X96DRAFT_13152 [Biscogniauxia mediterranea]|nr:hypothetical protein F5X96DRAFT_13152 [Biscogniauxia mediterranea]